MITVQKYSIRNDANVTQRRTQIFRNMMCGWTGVIREVWDVFSYGLVRPVLQT